MVQFIFKRLMKATLSQKICYVVGGLFILFALWNILQVFMSVFPYFAMAILGVILIVLAATKKV